MLLKFLRLCKDKNTNETYSQGQIKEFDMVRGCEIIKTGYAVEYKEEAKKIVEEPVDNVGNTEPVKVDVDKLTLKELKKCCEDLGLPTTGSKQELIERIKDEK